jgi:hypothetical protein
VTTATPLVRELQDAISSLRATLIASSSLLDQPFTNAPEQSPWTRTSARLLRVMAAADAIEAAARLAAEPKETP